MQLSPSFLNSLAQGCCALVGEVLGSYAGVLAPAHGGFLGGDARAAFDEAEPMVVRVKVRPDRRSVESQSCLMYAQFTCSEARKKGKREQKNTKR